MKDLKVGESGIVLAFTNAEYACKLLTIGLMPQTKITLLRKSPLGGAYYIKMDRQLIAVRAKEAVSIEVEII